LTWRSARKSLAAMLKDNPVMKKLVATGEERVGKLVQQLMSNETFVAGVQTLVSRALSAKGTLDKSIKTALSAMNLPSTGDLETLREKIDDLERVLAQMENKVDVLVDQKKK
jgi:polyhydroxyalkanoate synthesis regulator phasin